MPSSIEKEVSVDAPWKSSHVHGHRNEPRKQEAPELGRVEVAIPDSRVLEENYENGSVPPCSEACVGVGPVPPFQKGVRNPGKLEPARLKELHMPP
eukprot:CAMPEP_0169211682 /NCGR_PEP_ID=MMETSP1016-20121227/15884_1 /TAXON_ID=342587 /ORGANISM="Karlodinium micrum, Strain CCMP2283" /LENGTH=95 /DNA_ID=CAMNT_0009289317 /DNA_START=252 /DNA_END=540 /DNA_ORIENTATION=-